MAKMTARISALVTYDDGTTGQAMAMLDHNGNIAFNGSPLPLGSVAFTYPGQPTLAAVSTTDSGLIASYTTMRRIHDNSLWYGDTSIIGNSAPYELMWLSLATAGFTTGTFATSASLGDKTILGLTFEFVGRITYDTVTVGSRAPSWKDFRFGYSMQRQDDGSVIGAFVDDKATYINSAFVSGNPAPDAWYDIITYDPAGDQSYPLRAQLESMVNALNIALPAGLIYSASSTYDDGLISYNPDYVGDSSLSTFWWSTGFPTSDDPQWLQVQLPTPAIYDQSVLYYNDASYVAYTVQGSNDGSVWNTLGTFTHTTPYPPDHVTDSLENGAAYLYYRLHFTSTGGTSWIKIYKWTLSVSLPG